MLNMELARKYARAIFELACEENALSAYGNDLAKVQQTYVDCPELKAYLCNPNIQPEDKKALLKEVFGDEVREMVLNFLLLLIDSSRTRSAASLWRMSRRWSRSTRRRRQS